MAKRFVSIWFPQLITDWFIIRQPALYHIPFVVSTASHGRMIVAAASEPALAAGVHKGMPIADARALVPLLEVCKEIPLLPDKLLHRVAEWSIRFTPAVAVDLPDGILLDATGCSHLWGGDEPYLADIKKRLQQRGYQVRLGMADTIGAAWGLARYSKACAIAMPGNYPEKLFPLPAAALRLETTILERLDKLGLRQIQQFIRMPRAALRRRFGPAFIQRLDQALGQEEENIEPLVPVVPYQERLPCPEPIVTATGISIALDRLMNNLCRRLQQEEKGLRKAVFNCYRVDGKMISIQTGTHRATHHAAHLLKLLEEKINSIEPDLGIELFTLEGAQIEEVSALQEKLWKSDSGTADIKIAELLDRIESKLGSGHIHRYLPDEHHWPERSFKAAYSLQEQPATEWSPYKTRPLQILPVPEKIEVTAPIPDYPPMLFRYKDILHKIIKADGPERIEPEWWIARGRHRDYYVVEDEQGCRYWLFRAGHYAADIPPQWFLHGFFA